MLRCLGRRCRTLALLAVLLLLAGSGGGVYAYALHQYQAAQGDLRKGRHAEARRRLDFCLFVWPRSIPVRLLAARAARFGGDLEAAEAHLNRCLKLAGGSTEAIEVEFLLMRIQWGEVDPVAPHLMALVEQGHPETALILNTLTQAYMRDLRYGPALGCLDRWIKEQPDDDRPWALRGWVKERLGHNEADKDYERALELAPEQLEVRLHLVELLLDRSRVEQAVVHLDWLMQHFPDRPEVLARMGQARYAQGEAAEARRLLEAAVQDLPRDRLVLIHLGRLEMDARKPARAEPWLRKALEADPSDAEARFALFNCLRQQGKETEAAAEKAQWGKDFALLREITQVLKAETFQPSNDPAAATLIGSTFLRTGQDRLGLYWLEQALQRDRNYEPAHKLLAEYHEKKGNHKMAALHRSHLKGAAAP